MIGLDFYGLKDTLGYMMQVCIWSFKIQVSLFHYLMDEKVETKVTRHNKHLKSNTKTFARHIQDTSTSDT